MNRENKRKQYQKGYFKQNPCNDVFTCKECGRLVLPEFAGTNHRNHCPNCLTSLHIDNQPGDRLSNCGGHMDRLSTFYIQLPIIIIVSLINLAYETLLSSVNSKVYWFSPLLNIINPLYS